MNIAPRLEMHNKDKDIRYPCYVEVKYDGEFCVYTKGKLINKYGRVRKDIPITRRLHELFGNSILYGELLGTDGQAGDIYKLNSDKANPSHYVVFDVVKTSTGVDMMNTKYEDRREILSEIAERMQVQAEPNSDGDCVVIIGGILCTDGQQLWREYQTITRAGYEGVVCKPANSILRRQPLSWVKIKTKATADLMVQLIDPNRERIEVTYDVFNGSNFKSNHTLGVKCSNKQKAELKQGDIVEIEYQSVLEGGSLRHPVYKRKRDDKTIGDNITL